jgi:hypothetical protein
MRNNDAPRGSGQVGPGVRGAGWVIGLFFVFAVIVATGWAEGWWENNRNTAAAPAAAHHTTASGSKVQ